MRWALIFAVAVSLGGCGPTAKKDDDKVAVVASFYPVAYAAQQVGGDLVRVRNLTPAGVEPHDLELTSDDIDHIDSADAVFLVGSGFQPAVVDAAKRRSKNTFDVAAGLIRSKDDPHFWLDPTLMADAVYNIRDGLKSADPAHKSTYERNANAYVTKLTRLWNDYGTALAHCERKEIVTTHAAFGYLADRFGLTQTSVAGLSPDAEPSPKRIADLAALIRRDGVTTVFYEELVPRGFADTLAHDAHVKTAVLSPLEGLTKQEQARGETYITVMRRNLAALKTALGC
ncbi:MAG: zinc transport system substrate-binding protein [Actinomycetota bacterium]|jgi:zinc transport system substrate-binding protein